MADRQRWLAAAVIGASLLVSGCGGPPSKAEYVDKMMQSVGDLDAGMKSQNIDPAKGTKLIRTLVECQYEAIKDDDDLLQKSYDDPGDAAISVQLDTKSSACTDRFSQDMAALAGGG